MSMKACAVCSQPLNSLNGRWLHAHRIDDEDHPAIPVDASELATIDHRCDTCGDPVYAETAHTVPVSSFVIDGEPRIESEGDWMVCDRCAPVVESGDTPGLISIAIDGIRRHNPDQNFDEEREAGFRRQLMGLYGRMQSHRTGPVKAGTDLRPGPPPR